MAGHAYGKGGLPPEKNPNAPRRSKGNEKAVSVRGKEKVIQERKRKGRRIAHGVQVKNEKVSTRNGDSTNVVERTKNLSEVIAPHSSECRKGRRKRAGLQLVGKKKKGEGT